MKLFRNIFTLFVFFLLVNQLNAQQASSGSEVIGDHEITVLKKANTKVEKTEQTQPSLNNPTWERTKNPNSKEEGIVPKEQTFITNEKARKPE